MRNADVTALFDYNYWATWQILATARARVPLVRRLAGVTYCAVQPPSTRRTDPVTSPAAGEAR
jgi:hypothetical protein